MFKCLLLIQVLLVRELYSWEFPFLGNQLRDSLRSIANESVNSPVETFLRFDFVQKLDHFNPTDNRQWKQTIYFNDEFYRPGGPTFLMISDHNSKVRSHKPRGAWLEYAKLFGASCLFVQIRYMGDDWPTNDLSTENLKYLSSQQAIADVAELIGSRPIPVPVPASKPVPVSSKVIVFGGERGGSFAAWLRLKYPHLVSGAVASSAPLDFGVNYPDYFGTAVKLLSNHSKECVNGVRDAFKDLNIQLEDKNTQEQIKKLLNLCPSEYEPEVTPADITVLNLFLAIMISNAFKYSKITPCTIMANETFGTPLQRLSTFIAAAYPNSCVVHKYDEIKNINLNVDWMSDSSILRPYWYEKCTEFGLFDTSDDPSNVFGDRISAHFYEKLCTDIFGREYDLSALAYTAASREISYGGLDIDVTNVVFVDGSKNLRLSQDIVKNVNSKSPAIIIKGEPALADMWTSTENDSSELKEARAKIVANIKSWLTE